MKYLFSILLLLLGVFSFSQKHTSSGFEEDSLSGEKLIDGKEYTLIFIIES